MLTPISPGPLPEHPCCSFLSLGLEGVLGAAGCVQYFTHLVAALAVSKVIVRELKDPFHWTVRLRSPAVGTSWGDDMGS